MIETEEDYQDSQDRALFYIRLLYSLDEPKTALDRLMVQSEEYYLNKLLVGIRREQEEYEANPPLTPYIFTPAGQKINSVFSALCSAVSITTLAKAAVVIFLRQIGVI